MRFVEKGEEPAGFARWKAMASPDWQPSYGQLQNPEKAELQTQLLEEQGWVCCYCGRSIDRDDSHIEHFRPQEKYPEQALAYQNLHASCMRQTNPGDPLHCGHAKGAAFNENLHLSPLEQGCEQQFAYTLGGQVLPLTDSAEYMNDLLKLDLVALRNRRKAVLNGIFDAVFLADASLDELQRLQRAYQQRDASGSLPNFGHVVARFCQRLVDGQGNQHHRS